MSDYDYDETVRVFRQGRYDGDWPPEDFIGFESWVAEKKAAIPAEFLSSAKFEIFSSSEYGSDQANIEITYSRPPTPEEIQERKADARRRADEEIRWAEQRLANAKARRP